jgi:hypothetical protein
MTQENKINLMFIEDSQWWSAAWCAALGVGASANDAEIAAALAQWAYRDGVQ